MSVTHPRRREKTRIDGPLRVDEQAALDSNRAWQLAAARGDVDSPTALQYVRSLHDTHQAWADNDPEMVEALTHGDRHHHDQDGRWYSPEDLEPPPEYDPDTTDAFDRLIATRPTTDPYWDEPELSLADRMRGALLDTDAVLNIPPPDPLIDNYLMRDTLAVIYGPSGDGKTFLTLDWALHIATLPWWNHHDIHPGPVVYVIAEGVSGIGNRIKAWTAHNVTQLNGHPIHWLPMAINLTDLADVHAFIDTVIDLEPVLIVFDTLARCIVGADENSARDMGLVVTNLDKIRRATGACVASVHHSGKDTTNGARGSSALRAAMDTEIELKADDDRITLKVTKQKDGPQAKPLRLALTAAADSCVLVPSSQIVDDDELSAGATATLETLREIEVPGGIATGVWEDASAASRSVFYTHRKVLLERRLVKNIGTEKQPRYVAVEPEEVSTETSSGGSGPVVRGHRPPGPGPYQSYPAEQDQDRTSTGPVDQGKRGLDPRIDTETF